MRVVPYTPEHHDEMRAVCLATASERARTSDVHARFTLLMYCEPYLEHGTAYMLLDDDGVARGYVLCAEDYTSYRRTFEPYKTQIEGLGEEYRNRVAEELGYFEAVAERYPAHLHIDIEEAYTGGGNGRMLMETMIEHMREAGVRGVSFGVAPGNTRAAGFYEHMGFEHLAEAEEEGSGPVFCMSFE